MCPYVSNGGLCSPNGPPGPEITPDIGIHDRLSIDKSISDQQRPKLWLKIVRARQDASNGSLCSPNGPPGPEIAPVIGSSDRLLIDKSISDQQRPKLWLKIVRARQDASNGGIWSPNWPPEPKIAPVIGSSDRLLIDKSISDQQRPKLLLQMVRAHQDASNGGLSSPNGPP